MTLVAYFSASGVTKKKAEELASSLGADIYEIKPVVPYTKADLNWMDKTSRTTIECADKSFRPEMVDDLADISKYDTVYIGFPIWWYVAPNIIKTFVEKFDFSGKKIVVFATSGGSGFGKTIEDLKPSAPNAVFEQGSLN